MPRRDEHVTGILALRDARDEQPLRKHARHVLDRVDGEIGAPLQERLLDLLHEEALASHLGQRAVLDLVAGGDNLLFDTAARFIVQRFELFANFRPIKNLPGLNSRYPGIDLIIVRENTEDLYAGLEVMVVPGVAQAFKIITEKASTRIAKFAFDYAHKHGRKRIHSIHKANIMKLSDGLFLECARKVAARFPEIEYREHIVDNTCMQLVLNPYQYDLILTENLYGDILSDLCSAFVGGLGLVPGANLGEHCAVFEAVHGSAPDIAGKDLANPTALLQSAVLMLHHINEPATAEVVQNALEDVYLAGRTLTRDVGGTSGTKAFADAILAAMDAQPAAGQRTSPQ